MKLQYEISVSDPFIRVTTSGKFDWIAVHTMWKDIAANCETNNCYRVLGISMLTEPVPKSYAYEYPDLLQSAGISSNHRIAWVAERPGLLDSLRFIETVLKNRSSLTVRIFERTSAAEDWLTAPQER